MNFNIKTTYINSIMFIENKSLLVLYLMNVRKYPISKFDV